MYLLVVVGTSVGFFFFSKLGFKSYFACYQPMSMTKNTQSNEIITFLHFKKILGSLGGRMNNDGSGNDKKCCLSNPAGVRNCS